MTIYVQFEVFPNCTVREQQWLTTWIPVNFSYQLLVRGCLINYKYPYFFLAKEKSSFLFLVGVTSSSGILLMHVAKTGGVGLWYCTPLPGV